MREAAGQQGSEAALFELETQALLSAHMTFAKQEDVDALLAQSSEVARILNGLLKTLEIDEA